MRKLSKLGLTISTAWVGMFAVLALGGGQNLYAIVLFGFPWVFFSLGVLDLLGASHSGLLVVVVPLALNAVIIYKSVAAIQVRLASRSRPKHQDGYQHT